MASDAAGRTGSVCLNSGMPSSASHRAEIQERMGSEGRQELRRSAALGTEISKKAMAALSPVAASRDLGSIVRETCAGAKVFGTAPTARVQSLVKAWSKAVEPMGLGSAETRFDVGPGKFFLDSGVWTALMTEKSSGTRGAAIDEGPSTLAADDGGELHSATSATLICSIGYSSNYRRRRSRRSLSAWGSSGLDMERPLAKASSRGEASSTRGSPDENSIGTEGARMMTDR